MLYLPIYYLVIPLILSSISGSSNASIIGRFALAARESRAQTEGQFSVESRGDEYFAARIKRRRRRGCDRNASAQYQKMRQRWQKEPRIRKPEWRNGYRDITLYAVNLGIRVRVFPFLPDGTLDPEAVIEIEKAFADKNTRETRQIHPRLIRLLYKLAVRFKAKQINVISGFRVEAEGTESHHGDGTAMDIMIPGVKLPALAKVARRLGHVGVGYYPVSGFVHVDVREKASYFWVDPSGPGKRSCIRRIMTDAGPKFDRRWQPGDDDPKQALDRQGRPLGALEESLAVSHTSSSISADSQKTTNN